MLEWLDQDLGLEPDDIAEGYSEIKLRSLSLWGQHSRMRHDDAFGLGHHPFRTSNNINDTVSNYWLLNIINNYSSYEWYRARRRRKFNSKIGNLYEIGYFESQVAKWILWWTGGGWLELCFLEWLQQWLHWSPSRSSCSQLHTTAGCSAV